MQKESKSVTIFLLLAFVPVIAIACWTYMNGGIQEHPKIPLLMMMMMPAVAAIIVQLFIERKKLTGIRNGLWISLPRWRPTLRSVLLSFALIFGCMAIGFAITEGLLVGESGLAQAADRLPGKFISNTAVSVFVGLVLATLITALLSLPLMFGEEIGWRGYLTPKLYNSLGPRATLVVGAIWGLWHIPAIALGHNYPQNPMLGMIFFVLICIGLSIIFSYYQFQSRSVFAPAIMHGIINSLGSIMYGTLVVDSYELDWLHGPTGALMLIILVPLAIYFYQRLPDKEAFHAMTTE